MSISCAGAAWVFCNEFSTLNANSIDPSGPISNFQSPGIFIWCEALSARAWDRDEVFSGLSDEFGLKCRQNRSRGFLELR